SNTSNHSCDDNCGDTLVVVVRFIVVSAQQQDCSLARALLARSAQCIAAVAPPLAQSSTASVVGVGVTSGTAPLALALVVVVGGSGGIVVVVVQAPPLAFAAQCIAHWLAQAALALAHHVGIASAHVARASRAARRQCACAAAPHAVLSAPADRAGDAA